MCMNQVTFITGNQAKADYLAQCLDYPITHTKLDLVEIQSLDLREVVEHKVRQAYDHVKGPVLVEDVSLEFSAWGKLPGTFVKFFVDEVPFETICSLLDGQDRSAIARCVFGYYDGGKVKFIEGKMNGTIAEKPAGDNGFGWDKIFIPEGYTVTRASLDPTDYKLTYATIKPLAELKEFLQNIEI
jgi:inosine triphosphate pyrophosphatase